MRRNIFTSYIIRNCLNLKTFLKPIIYFFEIGNYPDSPLREPYMKMESRTAQAETQKLSTDIEKSEKLHQPLDWVDLPIRYKIRKIQNFFFVMIMPKNLKLAHLSFFSLC
jgi:hypothetical protein